MRMDCKVNACRGKKCSCVFLTNVTTTCSSIGGDRIICLGGAGSIIRSAHNSLPVLSLSLSLLDSEYMRGLVTLLVYI